MACVAHPALDPATALLSFRNHEVVPYDTQSHLEVLTSRTHQDYQPHPFEKPASPPPLPQRQPVPFVGSSSYSQQFVQHPVPASPGLPPQAPRAHCPFVGASAYKEEFKAHPILQPQPASPPPQRAPVPFQGCSTTHAAFVAHDVQPAQKSPQLPSRQPVPFQGSSHSHEVFKGHAVMPCRASIGIAILGDKFHVLIPGMAPTPTCAGQIFTTVHDDQDEVCFLVYQGDAAIASQNRLVGQFQLGPLPLAPAGSLKIQVTFYLDRDGRLSAEARDIKSGQCFQWRLHKP